MDWNWGTMGELCVLISLVSIILGFFVGIRKTMAWVGFIFIVAVLLIIAGFFIGIGIHGFNLLIM